MATLDINIEKQNIQFCYKPYRFIINDLQIKIWFYLMTERGIVFCPSSEIKRTKYKPAGVLFKFKAVL